jgi:hypothetical protein
MKSEAQTIGELIPFSFVTYKDPQTVTGSDYSQMAQYSVELRNFKTLMDSGALKYNYTEDQRTRVSQEIKRVENYLLNYNQ